MYNLLYTFITLVLLIPYSLSGQNIEKQFYNLPVDSCFQYIEEVISTNSLFTIIELQKDTNSKIARFKVNTLENSADSIHIQIIHDKVFLGNCISKIQYHYYYLTTKTLFFKDSIDGINLYMKYKKELDQLEKRLPNTKEGLKTTYYLPIKNEASIHAYNSFINKAKNYIIELSYSKMYRKKRCNWR